MRAAPCRCHQTRDTSTAKWPGQTARSAGAEGNNRVGRAHSPSAAQLLHSGEACAVYRPAWATSAASSAFFLSIAACCSASGILGGEGGLGGFGGGDGGDGGFGNGGGVGGTGGEGEGEGGGVEGGDSLVQRAQPAP